ncbi:MAG: hydrogenase maturation protease [marine benthic group bacterium]|jgi:hydrogenase maturation protease|nr:hydrogenase maturation protease [Candidatus Carthagonibacter metallireducens]MCL7966058.1 hydrogenase maturation protease [Gemmatimonadota bacterium]MCL7979894.1 hydrogenase maturation protease [Gemmatimonadota bacterium]
MQAQQNSIRRDPGERVLVLCWGNPGRLDDGLGPCLADRLTSLGLEGVTVESSYQLQIEHADRIAQCDLVVFVDAAATGPSPFLARPLGPMGQPAFSTHALEPGTVLALARELYGANPRAILVGVRGYDFDGFGERLSPRAEQNLEAARAWLAAALEPPIQPPQQAGSRPARRH